MARGLLGVGRVQKKQAMSGLIESAGLEARADTLNEQLKQQRKMAEAQTAGTLTAVGAAVGGIVGTVSEGFKVFSDPNSSLRQGFDSFVSSTSEKLSEWGTSAKESISNFASKSMDSVKTLVSGAKEVASNAYNYVKDSKIGKAVSSVGSKISSAASTAASYLNPFNYFANGGIVTRPTMGIIGEGGQSEAVIPLNRAGEFGLGGNQEVVALLKTLISEVRKGGNVYLDGNKVGYALALQSSQMG